MINEFDYVYDDLKGIHNSQETLNLILQSLC